jgi:hypothetical protein
LFFCFFGKAAQSFTLLGTLPSNAMKNCFAIVELGYAKSSRPSHHLTVQVILFIFLEGFWPLHVGSAFALSKACTGLAGGSY